MSTLSSIAIACFILLTWNQMANGLSCYSCLNCNDPFNSNYIQTLWYNDTQPWYCTKTSIGYNTSRSIAPSCNPSSMIGTSHWCCQSNLCNGANRKMATNARSWIITLPIIAFFF